MRKLTLNAVAPTMARILGVCETDPRVVSYANEAQERLIYRGKWVGALARYRICINSSCITWPRNIDTIEAFWVCNEPGMVRNMWYENDGNGFGQREQSCGCGSSLIDRGQSCCFDDIPPGQSWYMRINTDVAEAADARVLIQGYDQNGNWIRTMDSGSYVDGVYLPINTTPATTSQIFGMTPTAIIKPATRGAIRLYAIKVSDGSTLPLGYYESDETLPTYRRSFIPGLENRSACDCITGEGDPACLKKFVTVIAKLRHIPVVNGNDFFVLGNLPALKDMVQSIMKREKNLMGEAAAYEASALNELEKELHAYEGDGFVPTLRVQDRDIFGAGYVENMVN